MYVIVEGQLMGSYTTEDKVDQKTGEIRNGKKYLQLMIEQPQKEGVKMDVLTIPVDTDLYNELQKKKGQKVQVPAKVYAQAQNGGFATVKITGR